MSIEDQPQNHEILEFIYDQEGSAEREQTALQQGLETCMMRLEKQGGRACESCALNIENRIRQFPGVEEASATFMGGLLRVRYNSAIINEYEMIARIENLGVGLSPVAAKTAVEGDAEEEKKGFRETFTLWIEDDRTAIYLTVTNLITMLLGLGTEFFFESPGLVTVFYTIAYLSGGVLGLKAGFESLRHWTVDVDLLMILAAIGAAFVGAPFEGAMLLFLFSLSNTLQNYALDRTQNAIRSLMKLRPDEALVQHGTQTRLVPIDSIQVGDRVIVRPGERVPLDGEIEEGESALDQSPITGESIPVQKQVGDTALAGSINMHGGLVLRVTHLAQDSTIARLILMVAEAQSQKAKTQRVIDRVEQYYALGVILMTMLAIGLPIVFLSENFDTAFYRAMTLMVAASPCAVVISTPATVLSAIGNGARRGVLFKGGAHVEEAAGIRVIAFDKTGTLTEGKPRVTDVIPLSGKGSTGDPETELLSIAASVEAKSEHPLAKAIVDAAITRGIDLMEAKALVSEPGQGIRAMVQNSEVVIGSRRFFTNQGFPLSEELERELEQLENRGKTCVIAAQGGRILGLIGIADSLRPGVKKMIKELKGLGITRTILLTGDNKRVGQNISAQAGVDECYAELLPGDKLELIHDLKAKYGAVAMVGDGINDAPALAAASLGVAMGGAGTDVAMETADVILMGDDLSKIPYMIALSRKTRKTLMQNLIFAFGVILVLIASVLGLQLALPLSVIGHEGSTVLVSVNGLRLLGFNWSPADA